MTTTQRAWIRLPSGSHLDLINPSPDAWLDSDLAVRLSRTYRWSGESSWPVPLSVAQHSLTVLFLRQQWSNYSLSREDALNELLHDAEEGFLGFDCISPLKAVLGDPFKNVSDRLMNAIETRYSLPSWTNETHQKHKEADLIAAATEAVHCVGWTRAEVRDVLKINHPILEIDPLVSVYGCKAWEPWPSDVAASRFLEALTNLLLPTNTQ
ncbi:phosphohydrolase [Undibacterium sp.]|uniref:phosphohydrolase n=1 Tax=Undibacterium sp. TaxID=1914977 RepID=UPI0037522135